MTDSSHTQRKLSRKTKILSSLFALVLLGVCLLTLFSESSRLTALADGETERNILQTVPVVEAPFEYTVSAKGVVNSRKFANLESEIDGFTTVLWLIPAGTQVYEPLRSEVKGTVSSVRHPSPDLTIIMVTAADGTEHRYEFKRKQEYSEVVVTPGDQVRRWGILAGDIVCRLDGSEIELREKNFEILVHDYKAEFDKAKQDVEIRRALNESNNSKARLNADLAELDLKQYLEGTHPQEIEKLQGQIEQSREDLRQAQEVYQYTARVAEKGYKNPDEVEQARLKVLKLEHALRDNEKSLEVLENYDYERTLLNLTEKARDLRRDETRIRLVGEAAMAQFRMILASRERVYNIYQERLQKIRDQLAACTIVAPQSGQVIYATEGNWSPEPTAVGQRVRQRQDLIHLPDLSDMVVDARVHESLISRIHEGLPAQITVDALPGEVFESRISRLSTVPMPGQYPNFDRKEYRAEIGIEFPEKLSHKLRPGMTANVEIQVEQITEPVTQVPVQAVIEAGYHHFAWVATPTGMAQREISVGSSNDESFIVTAGLQPGEQVVSNPLDHFFDEIQALRERYEGEVQPSWESQQLARNEQAEILLSEEAYLETIGFYDDPKTEPAGPEDKSEPVSTVGD